ncbi:MAG: hypothetical protein CL579_03875 [Alteromonadaceae bacterium]|jgi:F0F1-type ATP synthase assembly protein I|nr:hypothetical protein [Alteromonadaceae bacterium]MBB18956.1 hypothetical protein [Rickettsiales bacterium]
MSQEIRGKISAIYGEEMAAKNAASAVMGATGLSHNEVSIVAPHDPHFDDKLENDDKKVGLFMLKAHMGFALCGVVLGVFCGVLLGFYGPVYTQTSPALTVIALAILGFFVGLMIAGLASLRPDQDAVVNQTREATSAGKWIVVVNSPSHEKTEKGYEVLNTSAESISTSL